MQIIKISKYIPIFVVLALSIGNNIYTISINLNTSLYDVII